MQENNSFRLLQKQSHFLTAIASSITVLAIMAAPNVQAEDDPQLNFSVGYDYSTGSYGNTSDTDIHYIPFSLSYKAFPWNLKLTVPYIRITGPGGVVGGVDGGLVIGTGSNKRMTEQGIGDVVVSTSYALDTLWDSGPFVDLTGKIKFATADEEKGLGTGENDYSLQIDVANTYGQVTPFATLGYKFMGDPSGIELDDIWFGSVGFDYKISSSLNGGVSLDFREATFSGSDDPREAVGYLNWKLSNNLSVMSYGVIGFSDGSPDTGVGLQLTYHQ